MLSSPWRAPCESSVCVQVAVESEAVQGGAAGGAGGAVALAVARSVAADTQPASIQCVRTGPASGRA